jgi:antitoxin MazE
MHVNARISMEAVMQVGKWGNSLAVRLPAALVEALEPEEGDEVEIHVVDARELAVARKPDREELLKRLRAFRGRLPEEARNTTLRAAYRGFRTASHAACDAPASRRTVLLAGNLDTPSQWVLISDRWYDAR